ncbi:amino acid permease [Candidatus Woesearchaeota archaeon]|nr:amino acid permease [Candidatus Woesearchaeota archaeon]
MAELKRTLSFRVILFVSIASIIGTGVFFLPAMGLKYSGPMSIIAWVILIAVSIYISMMFSELSSMFPKAGATYEYTKQAFGRFSSFLVGWIMFITSSVTIAILAVGAIQYLMPYGSNLIKMIICLFFLFAFNYVCYKGMQTSAMMMVAFSIITLGVLGIVILPGLFKADISAFTPFWVFPTSSIFLTLFFILETFFGWDSASQLAEEVKDAEKVMPKALIYGTFITGILVLALVVVMITSGHWQDIAESGAPLSYLASRHLGQLGHYIITMGTYLSLLGTLAIMVITSPRLVYALTRDRLFLPKFRKIHPVYHTPHYAILFQAIVSCFFIILAFGSYDLLLNLMIPLDLFTYCFLFLSLFMLRFKMPNANRPYKAPFGKMMSLLLVGFNIALVVVWLLLEQNAPGIMKLLGSIVFIGFPIYFLLEMYYNPKTIRNVNNYLAEYTLWTERIYFPIGVRKEIIKILGELKNKVILEFGCSVGTLTQHLAEEVGKKGRVYATDLSENHLLLAQNRMNKRGHSHVHLMHDEKHDHRIHPKVPHVDAVVSMGVIGYIQDVKNVLKDMNERMEVGSSYCIVDYDKYFHLIPNIEWLSNDTEIIRLFHNSGFTCHVERKTGIFWQYIYIYGKKFKNISEVKAEKELKVYNYVYEINQGIFNQGKIFVDRKHMDIGDGLDYVSAQFRMKSRAIKNYFLESYINSRTLMPEQFRVTLYKGREAALDNEVMFRKNKVFTMGKGDQEPQEMEVPKDVHDVFSAILKIKRERLETGKRFAINVFLNNDVSDFTFTVRKKAFTVFEDIAMDAYVLDVDFKRDLLPDVRRMELFIGDTPGNDIMMAKLRLKNHMWPVKVIVQGETGL